MADPSNGSRCLKRLSNPLPPPFLVDYRPYEEAARLNTPVGITVHEDCKANWDTYYRNNTLNGYKDRHYILREFKELRDAIERCPLSSSAGSTCLDAPDVADVDATSKRCRSEEPADHPPRTDDSHLNVAVPQRPLVLAEIGCGVGNTLLPLMTDHPCLDGIAFDISSVAVALLDKQARALQINDGSNGEQVRRRLLTGVVDISLERVPPSLFPAGAEGTVPFASLVFVLCSVPRDRMAFAVESVARVLLPGAGVLFWRDYAEGDMAMQRFDAGQRRVGADAEDATFARTNGTLSHFFARSEVEALFMPHFEVIELRLIERTVINRKSGIEMPRLWWQGRFRRRAPKTDGKLP
jgi:methyltransferase-like protein 6